MAFNRGTNYRRKGSWDGTFFTKGKRYKGICSGNKTAEGDGALPKTETVVVTAGKLRQIKTCRQLPSGKDSVTYCFIQPPSFLPPFLSLLYKIFHWFLRNLTLLLNLHIIE